MKGKAAAKSANRRLADALERVSFLETHLKQKEDSYRNELTDLRAGLQRARGTTGRQVKQLADEQVSSEHERASAAIHEARNAHLSQVVAGVAMLDSIKKLGCTLDQWVDVAEQFGVDSGPLMAGLEEASGRKPPRHLARTTNSTARWKNRVIGGIQRGELHNPGGPHKSDRWREG